MKKATKSKPANTPESPLEDDGWDEPTPTQKPDPTRTHARSEINDAEVDQVLISASGSPSFNLADPGSINDAVLSALVQHCPPDYIAKRIWDLCEAKRTDRYGNEEYEPRANEAGLKLALAYSVGKPIERQQIVTKNISADPVADIEERLAKSPALRASLALALANAERLATPD